MHGESNDWCFRICQAYADGERSETEGVCVGASKGLGMFATRKIMPGELIVSSFPFPFLCCLCIWQIRFGLCLRFLACFPYNICPSALHLFDGNNRLQKHRCLL